MGPLEADVLDAVHPNLDESDIPVIGHIERLVLGVKDLVARLDEMKVATLGTRLQIALAAGTEMLRLWFTTIVGITGSHKKGTQDWWVGDLIHDFGRRSSVISLLWRSHPMLWEIEARETRSALIRPSEIRYTSFIIA